jgi:hypothetical protein
MEGGGYGRSCQLTAVSSQLNNEKKEAWHQIESGQLPGETSALFLKKLKADG